MKISTGGTRNNGLGKVQLHPTKPLVKVTIEGEEGKEAREYTLNKEDCPDYVQNGKFLVELNADGTKMYSMRPTNGMFKLKVKEFVAPKDKEPTPKTKTSKGAGGEYTYQTFMVLFEIVEGKNKGMVVPGGFSYNFQESKEEVPGHGVQSVVEISHSKSQFTAKLIELLEVTNILKKQIPWKENILPLLQKMMLKEDEVFSGMVKKGWIDSLFAEDTVSSE